MHEQEAKKAPLIEGTDAVSASFNSLGERERENKFRDQSRGGRIVAEFILISTTTVAPSGAVITGVSPVPPS
jgi:hypothetical protein